MRRITYSRQLAMPGHHAASGGRLKGPAKRHNDSSRRRRQPGRMQAMGYTTHRDLKLAVELLGGLSAQPGVGALARAGVERLPELVASELTTLSVCVLKTAHRRVVCNPVGALSPSDMACFDRFFHEHPLV